MVCTARSSASVAGVEADCASASQASTMARWPDTSVSRISSSNASTDAGSMPSPARSEEHTSELQSLMRISYAVFCLKKKNKCTARKIAHHTLQQDTDNTDLISTVRAI